MSEWVKYFEDKERNIFNRCISCRRLLELIIGCTPPKGRILEVGCGTGILSLILSDYGFDVTASDVSPSVLSYAAEKIKVLLPNLKFKEADMFNLSKLFADKYFDTVFSKGLMEHFSDEEIIKGLAEQRKVSHRAIVYVPNSRSKRSFGDERLLSNRRWISLLRDSGFKEVRLFGDYDLQKYTYFFPVLIYHRRFSFVWRYISNHSIFLCQ